MVRTLICRPNNMTDQTKNIETLQTDVNEIARDLADLKNETSETLKKNKAEAAADKLKTTKEEITKKLEVLKGLTDANSQADIAKLEAMLITLESSDSELDALKIAVVTPIEAPKNNEAIDNTVDMESIVTGIGVMKTMITELQSSIDGYTAQKATMSEIDKTNKEKEIEEKKIAIEAKRKEIQTIIDKIKKVRSECKLEDIEDETLKAAIKTQKETEEKNIADQQKQLNALVNPATTFFEKVKNGVSKTWEKVKEWANKTRERAKENPKTAIAATAGIWLLVRWISNLFKKRKKNKEKDEGGEKKGFRSHGIGKFLKYAGIWVAWFFGLKWLLTGNRPWNKDSNTGWWTEINWTLRNTANAAESFEDIKEPKVKEALNGVGGNVNDLYNYVYEFDDKSKPVWLEEEKLWWGKEKYAGAIPHVLDNTFGTINDLQSERGLFTVWAYGDVDTIVKTFADLIGKWVWKWTGWMVNNILGMVWMSALVDEDDVAEKIRTFLAGKNTIDEVHRVFRKIFKTMAYLNYAENAFLGKKIEGLLKSWTKLYEKSGEKWEICTYDPTNSEKLKNLIKKIINNPNEYKIGEQEVEKIKMDEFRNKKIRDVSEYAITKDDILTYNESIKEDVEDINKLRKEKIELLEKDKTKALDKMKANVESELSDSIFKSVCGTVPIAYLLEVFNVGKEEDVKQKIMEYGWYKDLLDGYKQEFENMKREPDTNKIKEKIDKYYAQLKEVSITAAGIYETQDENGNIFLHLGTPVRNVFASSGKMVMAWPTLMIKWGKEVADGKFFKWARDTIKWAYYLGVWTWPFLLIWKSTRVLWLKLMFAPVTVPYKVGEFFLKPYVKTNIADWMPRIGGIFYKTPENLINGIANGMSTKSALRIYSTIKKSTGNTTQLNQNFVKEILWITDNTDWFNSTMMTHLIENKRYDIIDNMIDARFKSKIKFRKGKYINLDEWLIKLKPIYDILNKNSNIQEFGYKLLENTKLKDRSKIKDLLSRDDIVQELAKINKTEDINLMAKSLAKALKKVDKVEDSADTIKNIITNFKSIQTKAGDNVADVIETVVQQAASTHTTMTAEKILNQSDEITKQIQIIKTTDTYQDIASLWLETNAPKYANLLDETDDIDNITRKILNERNIADGKDYFKNTEKIAQAKAYAKFLLDGKKVEATIEISRELTSISWALSIGDYGKLAKLVNKGKSEDIVKFLTKKLEKEWIENAGELAQKFAERTNGMQNVDKTEIAKIIGLSQSNTEKAIIAITKSLASDKAFVASILALNGDQKLIADAINAKCWLTNTNALIAEESEYIQKLAKCKKSQDIEKTLQYTSTGLKWRIGISGVTAALAIAGAVMSILDAIHAFNLVETTNNEELKDVYKQRGYVNVWFAALDTLVAVDATCQLAYLALSIGQWAFMSTGVGAVVIVAAQGIRYLYDQYSLGAEFEAKNAEDWKKEWLWLYFIWYYRSGGKTSWENVKDTFGSVSEMPLANIVEGLIDQTLGIQEWKGTPDQQKVKWHMKEYINKKYNNEVDHMENGFTMLSEALEYATFAEYMSNIKSWTVTQEQITPDMSDFMSKYPLASNQDNFVVYFNKYQEFVNVQQTQNLEKYKPNLQKYSDQELTFIYEQLGRYNNYYGLSAEGILLLTAIRTLFKEKNIDISKLQLDFEEPPSNREEIEKLITTSGAEGTLQESIEDAVEVKWKIDQVVITDEDLIEKYWAAPTLELYTFIKIARIFGYSGNIDLDGIKLFLSEDLKDRHGIYRDWEQWKINNTAFWSGLRNNVGIDLWIWTWDEAVKNLKTNINKIDFDDKYLWAFDSAGIKVKLNQLRDDIGKKIELDKLQNIAPVTREEIITYLNNTPGKYTLLSVELLSRLLQKNNVKNSWHYLLKYENNKIIAIVLDSKATDKLFFIDEFDIQSSTKFKYETTVEFVSKPMLDKTQELKNIIYTDNDDFDVKQNPEIEKIITNKEEEINIFMKNLNNYDKIKQKELYYKKLEEVENFYQSFLISFFSQASDNTFSNDVDNDDADEKIIQATKYGERQNFNTVIVNKYKKEYNILQLSNQELDKFKNIEWWMNYVNYYYRAISLAMFKSYVLYRENGVIHTQSDQNLEIDELKVNLWDIKSYKAYMQQYIGKDIKDDIVIDMDDKIEKIKTLK